MYELHAQGSFVRTLYFYCTIMKFVRKMRSLASLAVAWDVSPIYVLWTDEHEKTVK